ncbi:universal stress protein [Haloferacaceae archaeon DSL9]
MAIETILLAIGPGDGDRIERLVEETIDVAKPAGSTVVLTHVFTDEEYADALDKLDFNRTLNEVTADEVAGRHTTTREIARALTDADVDYEIRGAVGPHGEQIVRMAEETRADRVLVGGRKRSPTGKAVFGSVAQEVMLSAPCPVTFVRSDTR